MATSEAILRVLSGSLLPSLHHYDLSTNNLNSVHAIKANVNNSRDKSRVSMRVRGCSRVLKSCRRVYALQSRGGVFHGKTDVSRVESVGCKCQKGESVSGVTAEDHNEAKFMRREANKPSVPVNGTSSGPSTEEFEMGEQLKHEKGGVVTNGQPAAAGTIKDTSLTGRVNLVEDEAWNLLRDSIVYYCNNPIGTIAANDPSNSSILNYDQVFIRDFIPSGIAFLLKGEYDIVRNFILYTLQLQVI